MPNEEKQLKNRSRIIIGILICLFILAYLIYQLLTYYTGSSISLYQVSTGSAESGFSSQYTALILRDETVVYASESGYVNFFAGDCSPVAVGDETCVIDSSGSLYEELTASALQVAVLNENELSDIKDTIYEFDITFDTDSYYDVYTFKYKLESQLFDTIYSSVFDSSYADLSGYEIQTCAIAGIMLHSTDGFEDISADEMEAAYFRQENYEKNIITSNEYVSSGDAVYKVVTSEEWNLVIQIDDPDVFEDIDSLEIQFLKDSVTASCDFYMYTTGGYTYGVLTLDKYMYRYVSDRYISISILNDAEEGLMIPKTSLASEQFYAIPADFLTTGGNSSSKGFLVQTEENGSSSVTFIVPEIITSNDEYVYVSSEFVEAGDILVQADTNETFTVRIKENIDGVYVSENGSYSFTAVTVIGENGDYYIVEKGGSLNLYDNIVYNAESVSD